MLLVRFPRPTLLYFVPAAALPCVAFLVTQYLAFGQFKPVYEEFGTKSYNYEGSVWNTPLEMDWFNPHPERNPDGTVKTNPDGSPAMTKAEPVSVYLLHMTFGHHGVFSLTPLYLFSLYGALRLGVGRGRRLRAVSWLTLFLTAAMLAFYAWNPKARNYGGSTQGLRLALLADPLLADHAPPRGRSRTGTPDRPVADPRGALRLGPLGRLRPARAPGATRGCSTPWSI